MKDLDWAGQETAKYCIKALFRYRKDFPKEAGS